MEGLTMSIQDHANVRHISESQLCVALQMNLGQLQRRWTTEVWWTTRELFSLAVLFRMPVWCLMPDLPISPWSAAYDYAVDDTERTTSG